jgi:hypothetical protein
LIKCSAELEGRKEVRLNLSRLNDHLNLLKILKAQMPPLGELVAPPDTLALLNEPNSDNIDLIFIYGTDRREFAIQVPIRAYNNEVTALAINSPFFSPTPMNSLLFFLNFLLSTFLGLTPLLNSRNILIRRTKTTNAVRNPR